MATTKSTSATMLGDGYIYISHLEGESCIYNTEPQYWLLPVVPDSISDTMRCSFDSTNALGRTAPVYTYSNSGPRTVTISLNLHRDIMDDVNFGNTSVVLDETFGSDYLDSLIKALQAIALPKYNLSNKAVEPPLVAVRIADQIFIKGVVSSDVGVTYEKPILSNGKYAVATLSITISEVDPYDSSTVFKNGSFRGVVSTLKTRGLGFSTTDEIY